MFKKILSLIITICLAAAVSCSSTKPAVKKTVVPVKKDRSPLSIYKLEPFMMNTADKDNQTLMRVALNLAFTKHAPALLAELKARRSQLRDSIIFFFNSKKKDEMSSMAQIIGLKKELKRRLNKLLQNGHISHILFTEFTIN